MDNKIRDIYGNDISFSSDIMSQMTTKGLLSRWAAEMMDFYRYSMFAAFMKTGNEHVGDVNGVLDMLSNASFRTTIIQPVLLDCVVERIKGIDEIIAAIYGENSDEMYVYAVYATVVNNIASGEHQLTDYPLFSDCGNDERLFNILNKYYNERN